MIPMIPGKLLSMATLLMLMTSLVVACGGGSQEFRTLPPEPTTAAATETPEPQGGPGTTPDSQGGPGVTPEPTKEVQPTQTPPEGNIELRVVIVKRFPDNTFAALEEGGVLTAKDHYGIVFEPAEESWVYITQQDSSNAVDVLFPNPAFSKQENPVPAGSPVWIPNDINSWFRLDETVGAESFFVVASKQPMKELESIISTHQREDTVGALSSFLGSGSRGLGGVEKLDEEPLELSDGKEVVLDEQILRGDGENFVFSLGFQHK